MNIYTIISKEATEKYADTYLAYNYYKKTVARLEENARNGYKVLCEYFNGSTTKTGLCVVSEDRVIEVLGLNKHDGKQVFAMMYELKLTERQNGMVVI
jgi:hypothetical protein